MNSIAPDSLNVGSAIQLTEPFSSLSGISCSPKDTNVDYVRDGLSNEALQEREINSIWIETEVFRRQLAYGKPAIILWRNMSTDIFDVLSVILDKKPTKYFAVVSLNGHWGFAPADTKVNDIILKMDGLQEVLVAKRLNGSENLRVTGFANYVNPNFDHADDSDFGAYPIQHQLIPVTFHIDVPTLQRLTCRP